MEDDNSRNGILVWIDPEADRIEEIVELCEAAGYTITGEIRQSRSDPDPRYYLGPGKIKEVSDMEEAAISDYLIVPSDLTPDQAFLMRRATGMTVIDRIRLILEIFRMRANTPESRLQVELADLRHQLPIVREYVHKGKLTERPGFMAGGEYQVDYYYNMIRKRMTAINGELQQIRSRRARTRRKRKRQGLHQIAIAGYTNAGKTTLINSLIVDDQGEKETEVSPRVFTTLSTSTRRMKGGRNCLITDTVGFIRDLPPWLVEGFLSTLEEVFESEIILLVVDISDTEEGIRRKLEDSMEILANGDSTGGIIIVGNKLDIYGDHDREYLPDALSSMIPDSGRGLVLGTCLVSANTGEGMNDLLEAIHDALPRLIDIEFEIPRDENGEAAISGIRKRWGKLDTEYGDDAIRGTIELEEKWIGSLEKLIGKAGGRILSE